MATSFPGSLDSYVNPVGSDGLAAGAGGVSHASMHSNVHDAIEAIQAKVGVNSSAVTSSLDYRMAQVEKGAPVGVISMYAGAAAPTGWMLCQGQLVDYATYPQLAAVFGVGGGSWNLPDLRQRVPLGSGTGYSLLASDGLALRDVTITEANLPVHTHVIDHGHGHTFVADQATHSHTISITDPGHSHSSGVVIRQNAGTFGGAASGHGGGATTDPASAGIVSSTTGITASASGADPAIEITGGVSNMTGSSGDGNFANSPLSIDVRQPYFVVNFIIRVDDI